LLRNSRFLRVDREDAIDDAYPEHLDEIKDQNGLPVLIHVGKPRIFVETSLSSEPKDLYVVSSIEIAEALVEDDQHHS